MPNYLISWSTNKVVLRNYEGIITTYKEPDSYEPIFCNRDCSDCDLQLSLDDADERKTNGIYFPISLNCYCNANSHFGRLLFGPTSEHDSSSKAHAEGLCKFNKLARVSARQIKVVLCNNYIGRSFINT